MLNKKKEEIYMNYTTQMDAAKKGIITPQRNFVKELQEAVLQFLQTKCTRL